MSSFVNQYSFVIVALGLVAIAAVVLLTRQPKWNDYLALLVLAGGLLAAWFILHPRQTVLPEDAQRVQKMIGAGTPVLLEFQSPYCIACTAIKPEVDALEAELGGRIRIIRVNVQDPVGRQLAEIYGFQFTPTFIMFDAQGTELWRQIGGLDAHRVRASLQ